MADGVIDEPQMALGLDVERRAASGAAFQAERLTEQPIDRRQQDSLFAEEPRARYQRMTMDEIRAVPWNGLTAVSSFSGCGGSSLGLRMAGWRVPYAIEFIPAAADTYEANSPSTFVDRRDVREIKGAEILERIGLERGQLDLFEGSPPCFLAGTRVITDRGRRPIDELEVGDKVLTAEGRYRQVLETMVRPYRGELVRLGLKMGREPVICTPEHPIRVRRRLRADDGRKVYGFSEWVAASDVQPGDAVLEPFVTEPVPMPDVRKRMVIGSRWHENYIEERLISLDLESPALAWMLGLYLAEGWRRGREPDLARQGRTRRMVYLSAVEEDLEQIDAYAEEAGLRVSVQRREDMTARRLTVGNPERRSGTGVALDFWTLCGLFGDGAGGKFIPEWVHGMNAEWRAALLAGYLFGDGHSTTKNSVKAASVSEDLTYGIARLVSTVAGVVAGVAAARGGGPSVMMGRAVMTRPHYALSFYPLGGDSRPANHRPCEVDDEGCWINVKSVERTPIVVAPVYNLEVEEDHSYVAGVAAHNCSSFSNAGSRESGWGKVKKYSDSEQRTDDLFDEYVRLIGELYPRAFLAENVPGLMTGSAYDAHALPILGGLRALGYRVDAKVLNAAAFGTPQSRRRLIIIGYREDQGITPSFPTSTQTVPFTLREALADVIDDDPADVAASSLEGFSIAWSWEWAKGLREKDVCVRCGVKLLDHEQRVVETKVRTKKVDGVQRERTRYYCADGEKAQEIRNYFMFSMPDLDLPCPTLTAAGKDVHVDSVVHPTEMRKLTPAEARSVCGFPADFVLTGTREQRYERMGRAVMPPLYEAVGRHIAGALGAPIGGDGA